MNLTPEEIVAKLEEVLPLIEGLATSAAAGKTDLIDLLHGAEAVATAANPAAGAALVTIEALIKIGKRFYTNFQLIENQTAETAPAVWQGIVDQGNIDDAAVAAQD